MRLCVINTYCGSLLIAAHRRKDEVIASLEDGGYGIPIQKANFPRLNYYETESIWPQLDLRDTVVIAHPPCSAFSSQNRGSAAHRGANSPKAQCTSKVLNYAMAAGAPAIAVESVPRALEGLRQAHEDLANQYRYDVYRLLINAGSMGIPQFRPRFWCLFFKRGLIKELNVAMTPTRKTIGDVMANSKNRVLTEMPWITEHTEEQVERIRQAINNETMFRQYLQGGGHGSVVKTLAPFMKLKLHDGEGDIYECACHSCIETRRSAMGWNFTSHSMIMLAPNDLAPTLLAGSWWYYKHRALVQEEYKEIMDFPRNYKFPGDYYLKRTREFLSRGVCPSTAEWILQQIEAVTSGKTLDGTLQSVIKRGEIGYFKLGTKARHEPLETTATVIGTTSGC